MGAIHTKGPWEACDPGDYGDFDGESRIILGDDMRIAVVHWHPTLNTDMSDANARLIAAAPDLLAAAQRALNFIENTEGEFGAILPSGDALRAAISKATSRQPEGER